MNIVIDSLPGGRGGNGGAADSHGHGGSGGTGEAPVQNYDIHSENFTMHISMQEHRPQNASFGVLPTSTQDWETASEGVGREFSGPARTVHHSVGARERPYGVSQLDSIPGLFSYHQISPLAHILC
jgi:hypothetical protein